MTKKKEIYGKQNKCVTDSEMFVSKKKAAPKIKVIPTMEVFEDDMEDNLDKIVVIPVKKNKNNVGGRISLLISMCSYV